MSDLDDRITPVMVPIANPANRELCGHVANLVVEAATHRSVMYAIYEGLCKMTGVAPRSISAQLIGEEERHLERAQLNLESLRAAG